MQRAMHGEDNVFRFVTPLAEYDFALAFEGGKLCGATFIPREQKYPLRVQAADSVQRALRKGVCSFLASGVPLPKVSLAAPATVFAMKFRKALLRLTPPGKLASYGDIARYTASSARAVGQACRSNHLALFVPCHRVIAAGCKLGGYVKKADGTPDLDLKLHLLQLEGVDVASYGW